MLTFLFPKYFRTSFLVICSPYVIQWQAHLIVLIRSFRFDSPMFGFYRKLIYCVEDLTIKSTHVIGVNGKNISLNRYLWNNQKYIYMWFVLLLAQTKWSFLKCVGEMARRNTEYILEQPYQWTKSCIVGFLFFESENGILSKSNYKNILTANFIANAVAPSLLIFCPNVCKKLLMKWENFGRKICRLLHTKRPPTKTGHFPPTTLNYLEPCVVSPFNINLCVLFIWLIFNQSQSAIFNASMLDTQPLIQLFVAMNCRV